jgi:hypothetical protein
VRDVRAVCGEEVDEMRVVHVGAVVDEDCVQVWKGGGMVEALACE